MRPAALLIRLLSGHRQNVAFNDFVRLLEAVGFELDRSSGSHLIYRHRSLTVRMVIQRLRGQAKSYQIDQFLEMVREHKLSVREPDGPA